MREIDNLVGLEFRHGDMIDLSVHQPRDITSLEKFLNAVKYRRFVEKISKNTLTLHKGALTRFIEFLFVQRSEIPELNEI